MSEAASAPYPGDLSYEEVVHEKKGYFVKVENDIRGMIPSWYVPHQNPDQIIVKMDGAPILSCGKTFTVADVPVERRWAIRPDGSIVNQRDFDALHVQWYHEYFQELVRDRPDVRAAPGKAHLDIPNVDEYVSVKVDPTNPRQVVQANYEPHQTAGSVSQKLYHSDGEEVEKPRIQVLCEAYADPRLRAKLRPHEVTEVETHLGLASGSKGEIASKLEMLNQLKRDGVLTAEQHSEQVARLTGAESDPVVSSDQDAVPESGCSELESEGPQAHTQETRAAVCGKEFTKDSDWRAQNAVRMHESRCEKCKSMKNED